MERHETAEAADALSAPSDSRLAPSTELPAMDLEVYSFLS